MRLALTTPIVLTATLDGSFCGPRCIDLQNAATLAMARPSYCSCYGRSRAGHLCSADSLVAGTYRRLASRRGFAVSHSMHRFSGCVHVDSLAPLENIATLREADRAGFLYLWTSCWNSSFHVIRV